MPINKNTMSDHQQPNPADDTKALIRKHKLYRHEWQRILNGEISRGEDYWGGYDDSIANDLTELEAELYRRACMQDDVEAIRYIYDAGGVNGLYVVQQWLRIAADALVALENDEIETTRALLESIRPHTNQDTNDVS